MSEISIYIHIPFCDHKCIYCDFYSIIKTESAEEYQRALFVEIQHYGELAKHKVVKSIFFGGGTPSFMSPKYIGSIIECINKNYNVSLSAEITLETNPGTVSKSKLKEFLEVGINRISIGIQSFDNEELKYLTRIHNGSEAIKTVEDANASGFNNISLDLIFNLPEQSKQLWQQNLKTAISLPVKHISAYSLILERGTILNKMVIDGKVKLQSEDFDADLYGITIDVLTKANFSQYEVSNFAQPGYECEHNKVYWAHKEYLGFGTSAHSFLENKRWWNLSSLKMYISAVENSGEAVRNSEILSENEMLEEFVMLNLRGSGLEKKKLLNKFGNNFFEYNASYLHDLICSGYLAETENKFFMTKKGYLICDEIIENLLVNI